MNNTEKIPYSRVIKMIYPHKCPHCQKDIQVSVRMIAPNVDWVLREEDIVMSKNKVRVAIETSDIPEEEKTSVNKWLDDENTAFGPEEVQQIIDQVLEMNKKNDNLKESKTK